MNNSGVSHFGWSDGFHECCASAFLRAVIACFFRASALFAVSRPIRAASRMFFVASPTAQDGHLVLLGWMVFPHSGQRISLRGARTGGGRDGAPFASRL